MRRNVPEPLALSDIVVLEQAGVNRTEGAQTGGNMGIATDSIKHHLDNHIHTHNIILICNIASSTRPCKEIPHYTVYLDYHCYHYT